MEKKISKPVLGTTHHHQKSQSGENEAESKRQPQPAERVLLVDKPHQIKKKPKAPVEKIKIPKRGLGVAKLEILRLEGKLQQMTEHLEQLQAEKENAAVAVAAAAAAAVSPPFLPPLLPRPPHQHHQQFQAAPFPPFVDPRQQYPNGMIPVPYGRFVPVGNFPASGAMNKDGPHPPPPPMNLVFQPMNQNGGYPGEPMKVIPNGGLIPTGNGTGGFIPAGHPHEPNTNMNGNGGGSPTGHHHQPNTNMNRNGGGSQTGHHHHEPNNNMIMNRNVGGFPAGGEVTNVGFSNQNIAASNAYMFYDQQLRVQHLKLMHSARELSAIQRMQYHQSRPSKFSVQMNPVINIEEPKSKDKMVMNDSADFLELSLGSTTNIDEKIKKEDDEITQEVVEVDPFGIGRRRRSTSSGAVMEYEFFPAASSDNRSSSYSGGGMGGSSEASTSNENTHSVDLSLKLSL